MTTGSSGIGSAVVGVRRRFDAGRDWVQRTLVWRVWERMLEIEFVDRSVALAGKAFVSFFPLVIVLAANLLLENFVEPKVMGRTLDIHPLVVLIVTALGGFLAGIVGLILAVPFTVIAGNAIGRLRSRGFFTVVADRAQPTVKGLLD